MKCERDPATTRIVYIIGVLETGAQERDLKFHFDIYSVGHVFAGNV